MTLEQAKNILRTFGKPTCPCKYENDPGKMIAEAVRLSSNNSTLNN
jgi:hypothetical protein